MVFHWVVEALPLNLSEGSSITVELGLVAGFWDTIHSFRKQVSRACKSLVCLKVAPYYFSGPAHVPMMSPNGSMPPIFVPPGYVSQVNVNLFSYLSMFVGVAS